MVGFRSDRVEVEIEVGQNHVMVGNSCLCDHFEDRDGYVDLSTDVESKE